MSNEPATPSLQLSTSAEHPIRNAAYRRWLLGSAVSLLGDQLYLVAVPWLVLQELGSAETRGTVLMAGALPGLVLTLIGGVVSDRFAARRVMIVAAAARAVCVAAIGGTGGLSAWKQRQLWRTCEPCCPLRARRSSRQPDAMRSCWNRGPSGARRQRNRKGWTARPAARATEAPRRACARRSLGPQRNASVMTLVPRLPQSVLDMARAR